MKPIYINETASPAKADPKDWYVREPKTFVQRYMFGQSPMRRERRMKALSPVPEFLDSVSMSIPGQT